MKRKKFIKNLMSEGIGRNAANWLARRKSAKAMQIVANITALPGFICITGVSKVRCVTSVPGINRAIAFRVKREVNGRG